MASNRIERLIDAPAGQVWDAIRDLGALHTRLVPGFVVDTVPEPGARVVTFGNGMVVREVVVDVDDARRRFAYSVRAEGFEHHNASNEILDEGENRCRFIWIADLLPDALAATVGEMMGQGADVLKATMEKAAGSLLNKD
ncbi:MAG: SRPBCC family protein [Brevundimonas sp.]|uniref:SRPBCC family protein n=1 Tax=Brevundimonas sp. TaxID=1871086 RepID=UPI00248A2057|nr:SRPBCC family protein [Brevundimonas sp.]MDI1327127.1 SRPBCC family protein [Brevundimonas sp.]